MIDALSTAGPVASGPEARGDAFYSPGRIRFYLSHLGELAAGRWPVVREIVLPQERVPQVPSYESRPPTSTILVYADLMRAVDDLPEWERRCVWAFAATLGGGAWEEDYLAWHWEHCDDTCDNRVYNHAARYLGRRTGAVAAGVKRACCRMMLSLGGRPNDRDRREFARALEEVGWDGPEEGA